MAANSAGQGTVMAALNCLFYPLVVPFSRYSIRQDRGIEGNILKDVALGICWYKNIIYLLLYILT